MKYKITVEALNEKEDKSGYGRYDEETIYEQTVEGLNLSALVSVVNSQSQVRRVDIDDEPF